MDITNFVLEKLAFGLLFLIIIVDVTYSDQAQTIQEMRAEMTNLMTKNFCDENYINCIGLNRDICVVSMKNAMLACPIESVYHTVYEDNDSKTHEQKFSEIEIESNKFSSCVVETFKVNSGVDIDAYPECKIPHIRASK